MSREIKFRAWDNEQMLTMPVDGNYGISRFFGFLSDNAIVMQFTGLTDKNGKEIYEGDECYASFKTTDGTYLVRGVIKMDEYMWCLETSDESYSINRLFDIEVIGNIHQNPELLKS